MHMSRPDNSDSYLTQFKWQSTPDSNLDRKDLLLCVFAEQRSVAEQLRSDNLDQKDYLLTLIDSASTPQSAFDARRMRAVIMEAATRGHWGKPPKPGRAQGIAAHFEGAACIAVLLDVEVSDEGRLTIHDAVVVADVGTVKNPGRIRTQLEGACLMGVAFVTSCDIGPTTGNPCPVDAHRAAWPLVSVFPRKIAVHLMNPTEVTVFCPLSQASYVPVVRALCNAIFSATGQRTRNLPFRSQLLERTGAS
jgi:isoquinoline 1-oxidoreductase beta subunit